MSYVTDLVFIARRRSDVTVFQDAVEKSKAYRPLPLESGDHCTSLFVFHLGVDYMDRDLRDWLTAHSWGTGTVLYMHGEDEDEPDITTWQKR